MAVDLVELLRRHDVPVDDRRVPGRSGTFTPCGLMIHHTASGRNSGNLSSLGIVTKGRGAPNPVPGPLSQLLLGRDGTVVAISDGRCNHPGNCDGPTIMRVRNGEHQGNPDRCDGDDDTGVDAARWLWGIECENDGVGEPWPPVQYDRLVDIGVAFSREYGWDPWAKIIAHKKGTRRKIDPSFPMGPFLNTVAARLQTVIQPDTTPTSEVDDMPSLEEIEGVVNDRLLHLLINLTGSQVSSLDDATYNLRAVVADIQTGALTLTLAVINKLNELVADGGTIDAAKFDAVKVELLQELAELPSEVVAHLRDALTD